MKRLALFLLGVLWSAPAAAEPPGPPPAPVVRRQQLGVLGLDFASLRAREDEERDRGWAALLSMTTHGMTLRGPWTLRTDRYVSIGGGNIGFAGEFDISAAYGYRHRLDADQGLVARAGVDLWSGWVSWLAADLPQIDLGYQYFTRRVLFDAGLRGALTMGFGSLHRGEPDDLWAIRPATGGYVRAAALGLELAVDAKLMPRDMDRSDLPFAVLQADLCTGQGIGICTRYMHMAADVHYAHGQTSLQSWNVVQLVAGFGFASIE